MTDLSAFRAAATKPDPTYEELKQRWDSLGPFSEHGDPIEIQGNSLVVRVADEAAAHALEFLKPIILRGFGYGVEHLRYRIASWHTVNLHNIIV